jgi:hypothetical protein
MENVIDFNEFNSVKRIELSSKYPNNVQIKTMDLKTCLLFWEMVKDV